MTGITCECRTYGNKLNLHSHPYGQLILPLYGELYLAAQNETFDVNENMLAFIPPDLSHAFCSDHDNKFLVLDIPKQMVSLSEMEMIHGVKKFSLDKKWEAIRYLLLNEMENSNDESGVCDLFYYLYHSILEKNSQNSLQYIHEHYAEEINIKILADIEHYNIGYYSTWFKKKTNYSVSEYIKNVRIKKAKELLSRKKFSILEVAHMVGYEHNSSLTRVFKQLQNETPKQFKKRYENLLKNS